MQNKDQKPSAPEESELNSGRPIEPIPQVPSPKPYKKWILIAVVILLLGVSGYFLKRQFNTPAKTQTDTVTTESSASAPQQKLPGVQLDTAKDYGNKYADGILPVGDGKYVTTGAKKGYVYACSSYARNLATDPPGAMARGPWFSSDGKTYDINKKAHVEGDVHWVGQFSDTISGSTRTIISNDLPLNHATGVFPVQNSDPAYIYDRNPNTITSQSFVYSLSADPSYSSTPSCIGGTVGVMLTGVQINSAFDAGGRDAGAWEVQDSCSGHPQQQGVYHYHTLSSCIKNINVNTVIGFALDGFPITGPRVSSDNILTTSDLDECHGITSNITLDGKSVTMYHYVMTQDFPYSVSCYRGTAIQPPGLHQQQDAQQGGQIPNRQAHDPAGEPR